MSSLLPNGVASSIPFKSVKYTKSFGLFFLNWALWDKVANTTTLGEGEYVARRFADVTGFNVEDTDLATAEYTGIPVSKIAGSTETMKANRLLRANLEINNIIKKQISDLGDAQAYFGMLMGKILGLRKDAEVLRYIPSAYGTFDNGSLTGGVNDNTPITISASTVPNMVGLMDSFLAVNMQDQSDSAGSKIFVLDPITLGLIRSTLIIKNVEYSWDVFKSDGKNFAGKGISGSNVYQSLQLPSSIVIAPTANFAAADTVTVGGVVFTAVSVLTGAGQFIVGGSLAASLANLVGLLNNPATTNATQQAFSAATVKVLQGAGVGVRGFKNQLDVTVNPAQVVGSTLRIDTVGAVRVPATASIVAGSTITKWINCYYGFEGGIDVVTQSEAEGVIVQMTDRLNKAALFEHYYGIQMFSDNKRKFLCVKVAYN